MIMPALVDKTSSPGSGLVATSSSSSSEGSRTIFKSTVRPGRKSMALRR